MDPRRRARHDFSSMASHSGRCILGALLVVAGVLAAPGTALARRHTVRAGQTLGGIAARHGCSIDELRRANRLRGDRIDAGQVLVVPGCGKRAEARATAQPRRPAAARGEPRRAAARATAAADRQAGARRVAVAKRAESVGKPWRGRLRGAVRLPQGKGYLIRRPLRAWGTPELVDGLRDVLAAVHADHPEHHTLAIGDLSARHGGRITEHRSHQSGRDVDVGFFYTTPPAGYPASFAVASADNLDRAATWDLVVAFARTAGKPDGVEVMFLDYDVQGLLYDWAKEHGVAEARLDRLFQYPDGRDSTGLIRHEPHHDDHLHVRFRCAAGDAGCL